MSIDAIEGGVRHSVTVRGQRLHVHVRPGAGSGPPLVLANGIGVPLSVLEPFVEALDPALEVIRFDAPGVGASPAPAVPYRYPALAGLLGAALDRLGYGRVDLLGLSWGGALAQQFAFQNPRRCRRLVLVATGTGATMIPARPRVLRHMLTPARHRDPAYARRIAGDLYGGSMRAGNADSPLAGVAKGGSNRGYLYQLLAPAGWSSVPFLPLLQQRTLVLAGEDDPLVPLANARILARLIPRCRLETYPDGHLGLLVRAPELAATVAGFLREP